jgi:hypothetical protein
MRIKIGAVTPSGCMVPPLRYRLPYRSAQAWLLASLQEGGEAQSWALTGGRINGRPTLFTGGVAVVDVSELTDDKSLPKAERERLQIEHAPHMSGGW